MKIVVHFSPDINGKMTEHFVSGNVFVELKITNFELYESL